FGTPKLCSLSVDGSKGTLVGDCYIPRTYSASGQYRCQWSMIPPNSNQDLASAFVLVTFTESGQQYYHASSNQYRHVTGNVFTGPKPLTLRGTTFTSLEFTCNTPDLHPPPQYTWEGVECDDGNQLTDTCRFTPRFPEDEGRIITCSTNFIADVFRPRIVTTDLDPPDPPLITGHRPGQVIPAGSALSLLCIVNGGTPKVRFVTFYCGDHGDREDVVTQTAVSSAVNIITLGETDNGTVCRCRAAWEKDPTLNLTTSLTLVVQDIDPPDDLVITDVLPEQDSLRPLPSTQKPAQKTQKKARGTEASTFPVAAVAGGIGAVLAIIIIVIVITVVVRRLRMKTYDHPNRSRDQDPNPYTGLRPTGTHSSRISGTANAVGVYEEIDTQQGQQLASNTPGRHQSPSTEANELHDYSNTTASAHDQNLASAFVLVKFTESGQVYYHASCGFSTPVPAVDGNYNFYITFTPGTVRLYVGSVNIANENRRVTGNVFTSAKPLTLRQTTSTSLEFTCNTPDLQPPPEYRWEGVQCDDGNQQTDTCRFTPRFPDDDERIITCRTSFIDDVFRPREVTTDLDPPDPPLITGHRPGQVIPAGSALSLLCIVNGGTPKVKSITFYCGDHGDREDVVTQTAVSSAVNIITLGETDNGTVCKCTTLWEKDPTLNLTTSLTLVVQDIDPPDDLVITGVFPSQVVHVGEALSLVCFVTDGTQIVKSVLFFRGDYGDIADTTGHTAVYRQPTTTTIYTETSSKDSKEGMKTYDHPNRRRDQDANPYTGLRPTGTHSSRISGTANAVGVYEEIDTQQGQQLASNTPGRHQSPSTEAKELHDYSNTTAAAHVYQNTLQSSTK
ncbi:hypothetical protein BaRGS_00028045, partial [Batillaria attramentaria]